MIEVQEGAWAKLQQTGLGQESNCPWKTHWAE